MKLLDILTSPWAIMPAKYAEIQEIYFTHLRGDKIDFKGIENRIGVNLFEDDKQGYQITNGIAVIPINGVIAKNMSLFSWLFGGVSTRLIAKDFEEAMNDRKVKAILFDIDSPGGTVDGTQDLANLIYKSRGKKPITAYTDGMMASAAYWIGSAADEIYISSDTAQIGSIGVVAAHVDVSKYEETRGIKVTEIVAGKYKRIASQHRPLTEEGQTSLQEMVDYIYGVFVGDVAKFKGIPEEEALKMADGKLFMGKQAVEHGLVDGKMGFSDLIGQLNQKAIPSQTRIAIEEKILKLKEEVKENAVSE